MSTITLVTVASVFDSWSEENIYTLHRENKTSLVNVKPLRNKDQKRFKITTVTGEDVLAIATDKIFSVEKKQPEKQPEKKTELTLDMVRDLALQLSLSDQAKLVSQLTSAIAVKLTDKPANKQAEKTPQSQPDKQPEEIDKKTLDKEYPVHFDRLVSWLRAKYPNISDEKLIVSNWGSNEINGIKKVSDKQVAKIMSVVEQQEIGERTINEELNPISFLLALKHGVVSEYLKAVKSSVVFKVASDKQINAFKTILKRWEGKEINFALINNVCKRGLHKADPSLAVKILLGKAELPQ